MTRAALIAASVAIFSGTASAAVQQTLTSNHVGAHFGTAPQVDSSGNVWTLMDSGGTTYLMKFQPDGSILKSVPIPNPFVNNGCHLLVDSSNNVYLDTWEDDRLVATIVIVRKFSSAGTLLWGGPVSYTIAGPNTSEHAQAGPMALGSDGSLYVVGRSGANFSDPQTAVLLRINPSSGAEVNRRNLAATTDLQTPGMRSTVLATDSAGNVYYGGPQGLWSFSQDLRTQRWASPLVPRALAVDSANGALYVTGVGSAGTLIYNMFVARVATSGGNTVWSWAAGNKSFSFAYGRNDFVDDREFGGNKIVLDSTGQVYAAGHGVDGLYDAGIVAKFAPDGTNLWLRHYGPNATGASVCALAIDNMNDLYVAGIGTEPGRPSVYLADLEIVNSAGTIVWYVANFEPTNRNYTYEAVDDVAMDRNGNTYWKLSYDSSDQGSDEDLYGFVGPSIPDGTYTIVGLNSGMAVDDPGSSRSTGTQMDQWTVNNGANQKWTVTNLGNNTVRLVNQASGLTLGVRSSSTANGAAVEQNTWTSASNQKWVASSTGTLGYFTLKNANSGQMLDVVGASKTAGALLDQWPASGGANQAWHLQ